MGVASNNCKARYYSITKDGKRQVKEERSDWERLTPVVGRAASEGGISS
jgi:hypothetical protein